MRKVSIVWATRKLMISIFHQTNLYRRASWMLVCYRFCLIFFFFQSLRKWVYTLKQNKISNETYLFRDCSHDNDNLLMSAWNVRYHHFPFLHNHQTLCYHHHCYRHCATVEDLNCLARKFKLEFYWKFIELYCSTKAFVSIVYFLSNSIAPRRSVSHRFI